MQKCSPEANASLTRFCMGFYTKGRMKNLRFSHALYNVVTYELMSANNSTLIILTGLPAQHLMAILCDEYHDFPLS